MIFSQIFIDNSLVISYNTVMKTSCAGTICGLWDELNQGLFPWIDDNIGELDAAHRLFMAVCESSDSQSPFEIAARPTREAKVSSRISAQSTDVSAEKRNGRRRYSGSQVTPPRRAATQKREVPLSR